MNPSLMIQDDSLKDCINIDFQIETLDRACGFSEGPIWSKEGYYLFSDIPRNIICKIGSDIPKEVYLQKSGCDMLTEDVYAEMQGSNGLGYNNEGNLIVCQHGNHGLAQYNGIEIERFITTYKGKPFNSPNDLIIHENGTIFFSDPPYGLQGQKLMSDKFQPLAGVYCWQQGNVELIFDQYQYPNGLILSPDQQLLYVCSNKPFERFVTRFEVADLSKHKVLCAENGDGIECDKKGNIYLCAKEGIVIVNSEGRRLGVIQFPTIPANLCWGGADGTDLLVTARQNIFFIRNLIIS